MEKNILNKIFPPSSNSKDLGYDNEGLWSITLPQDADTISQIILNESNSDITIFDGTAGLGGNTISFAKYFKNVIAVEMNKDRFMLLQNNIKCQFISRHNILGVKLMIALPHYLEPNLFSNHYYLQDNFLI